VQIDDDTPWVRDFSGRWGRDSRDPFGGESAPTGPKHERDGIDRMRNADMRAEVISRVFPRWSSCRDWPHPARPPPAATLPVARASSRRNAINRSKTGFARPCTSSTPSVGPPGAS
jgi:hypothetical protein